MTTWVLVIAMAWVPGGQSGPAAVAGTWTAESAGRTFLRLELRNANGTITGGISVGDIEVDSQGVVSKAGEPSPTLSPISGVTLRGSVVSFSRTDGNEIDRFELHLLPGGSAELRFILSEADRRELAAEGIPTPKPIRLSKR
jgi:hypothetical protein